MKTLREKATDWLREERQVTTGLITYGDAYIAGYQQALADSDRTIQSRRTDPATSHMAERNIRIKAGNQRTRLLEAFSRIGGPATDYEAMMLADGVRPESEYSKRCSELRQAGLIEPTGESRASEPSGQRRMLSVITEAGLMALPVGDPR